ncbi:MAG: helix-turn-helix domain-containing protein [Bacteroidota bacterium]
MDIGYLKFIRPKAPQLQALIKGYYVHTATEADFFAKITFYQNITTTISIYRDSVVSSEGRLRRQHHQKNTGFLSLLVGLVDKYQDVEFHGPLDRLAIVFYPTGINHFIRSPLSNFLKRHYSVFHYFDPYFEDFLPKVYEEPVLENKRDMLDAFFLDHYQELGESKLLKAVESLVYGEDPAKVDELAQQLNLSRRTLLRKFKKHLGYSLEEYISVIKFRRALYTFQNQQDNVQLTNIAYTSNYYDQPDFNRQIKSRSGLTPKELFAAMAIIDDTLFWKL